MCGIAGMVMKREMPPYSVERFVKSCDLMQHRGPDNKGVYRDGRVLLVHFRLGIIDLSEEANQPFHSQSGRTVGSYNGEIYNFRDLALTLKVQPRTRSDTEVMLETFEQQGSSAISAWNGIFSLAIHDRTGKTVHLVRDRFGVKPLYYFETEEALLFASEAKIIFDWLPSFRVNPEVLSQFMLYGHPTGTDGFVRGLKKLSPGEHATICAETGKITSVARFWALAGIREKAVATRDAIQTTRELLAAAVERQLVSDVPVALFLSGGVDSSTIAALAHDRSSNPLEAYSLEYDTNIGGRSEMDRAKEVARRYGLRFNNITLSAAQVQDVFEDVVFQYDEPFADPAGIALYQLSEACGASTRVVLQGDGGDELFAGYRRYNVLDHQKLFRWATSLHRILPKNRFRQRLERLHGILSRSDHRELIARYLTEETCISEPFRVVGHGLVGESAFRDGMADYIDSAEEFSDRDLVQQILYTDTSVLLPYKYLEKVDKATMRFSIESRVPFLDNELAEFALSLPSSQKVRNGKKKFILKEAMRGLVPDRILFGQKRGFDMPVRAWMQRGLHDHAADLFSSSDPLFINRDAALKALSSYQAGELESVPMLWKTMVLAQWFHRYSHKITM